MKKAYHIKVNRVAEAGEAMSVNTPDLAVKYWKDKIATADWYDSERECLIVIILNTRMKTIGHSIVSIGSLNESLCHPRDVFRAVVAMGAYGFVLMHNHPSGDPSPSQADRTVTSRIADGARILQVQFLDHVIVGTDDNSETQRFSFKEAGNI